MKLLVHAFVCLSSIAAFVSPAYSQDESCAALEATITQCSGSNNCQQSVVVTFPTYGELSEVLPTITWCCDTQVPDYVEGNWCNSQFGAIDRDVLEFATTHTLWVADCSGRFGPFSRLWTAPKNALDLRPRITLN